MILNLSEWIDFNIYFFGSYEKRESRYLSKSIKEDDICFDVGANIGYYTLLFSSCHATCYSFEPHPRTFEMLRRNVALNKNLNANLYQSGISSDKTDRKLYHSSDTSGNNSFEIIGDSDNFTIAENETIDIFCSENGINYINFLKVDVEGHEMNVIQGALRMIKSGCIENIYIEHKGMIRIDGVTDVINDVYDWFLFDRNNLRQVPSGAEGNILLIKKKFI